MYLLDTNTLIYAFRQAGRVRERMATQAEATLNLCTVNLFEFEYGFAKSADASVQRGLLDDLTSRVNVLDFDSASARLAGRIKAYLQKAGTPIGPYDLLIAATALSRNLIVVTRNEREFARVPGLRVENWYD
ncbi:type II toxin-antitoxin system VapC family toxin [Variovorax sp. J22R133]|uniref:type II toxin-antitoxin system VapC family toxin n=1 Tax=Variovorax brevis TaxID=3053503 RepID=UPI002575EB53|nr:type II toxin-antitoxin system VapC family toxin [Variovorax sp. J22R133]MDM0112518.1 type II toxin-antitoxin system VapC family toxin [Variovorax sp. J22R133]